MGMRDVGKKANISENGIYGTATIKLEAVEQHTSSIRR